MEKTRKSIKSVRRLAKPIVQVECLKHGDESDNFLSSAWTSRGKLICKECCTRDCDIHGKKSLAYARGKCIKCVLAKDKIKRDAKKVKFKGARIYVSDKACTKPKHAHNKIRMCATNVCLLCNKINTAVQNAVRHTKVSSKEFGLCEITTKHIYDNLEYSKCNVCRLPVFVSIANDHPRGFSLGRLNPKIGYSIANTIAQHNNCNRFQKEGSVQWARKRLSHMYKFHISGKPYGDIIPPDPTYPKGANHRCTDVYSLVATRIRNRLKHDLHFDASKYEHITREFVRNIHAIIQKGLCAICGLPTENNISIDQIVAGGGYNQVQIVHEECNCGKNQWPVEDLLEVAKVVYDQETKYSKILLAKREQLRARQLIFPLSRDDLLDVYDGS